MPRPERPGYAGKPEAANEALDVTTRSDPVERAYRRLARLGGNAAAVALVCFVGMAALLATGMHANRVYFKDQFPRAFWIERLFRVVRPAVYDADGVLAGFIPPSDYTNLDRDHSPGTAEIPEACIRLVLAREDAHIRSWWRHWGGVDLGSLPRAFLLQRGGSTLAMQLARLLAPEWKQDHRALRKLKEWAAASTITDLFENDPRALAIAYLNSATYAVVAGDIKGIEAFAATAFGKRASELEPSECALAAVAVNKPIFYGDSAVALARWESRKSRATELLQKEYAQDAREHVEKIASLGPTPPLHEPPRGHAGTSWHNIGARTRAVVGPNLARVTADLDAAETQVALAAQGTK